MEKIKTRVCYRQEIFPKCLPFVIVFFRSEAIERTTASLACFPGIMDSTRRDGFVDILQIYAVAARLSWSSVNVCLFIDFRGTRTFAGVGLLLSRILIYYPSDGELLRLWTTFRWRMSCWERWRTQSVSWAEGGAPAIVSCFFAWFSGTNHTSGQGEHSQL